MKKKSKAIRQLSPVDLLKLGEEHLRQGRIEEALNNLRQAEPQLTLRTTVAGKKISVPPHLIAAQAALPPLLARALAAHAQTTNDLAAKLNDFTAAAKYAPDDVRYRIAQGVCRLLLGETQAAQADFEKAEEQKPGDSLATRAFALGLLTAGQTRAAGDLIAQHPEDARWRRLASLRAVSTGNYEQVNATPLYKGLSHLAVGDGAQAQEQLNDLPALSHNPTRGEAAQLATQFFYSGLLSFQAGNHPAALSDWREAQRMLQAHHLPLPWRNRLAAYYHKIAERAAPNNLPLALDCWRQILQITPNDPTAQANLGAAKHAQALIEWRAGRFAQAAAIWQEALQTQPQDEHLLRNLALACEKLDRKPEAVTHWRALSRVWRQQAKQRKNDAAFKARLLQLQNHLVKLMLETDQSGQSIVTELDTMLNLDPDNPELRLEVVDQLLSLGRPAPALKHLEALEKQQGASAELFERKGQALDLLNRFGDARKALERAMELEPDNSRVRRNYVVFLGQEAMRAAQRHDTKRATEICQRQLELDPTFEPALTHLASLYFDDDRNEEAKALLERLIALDPNSPQKRVAAGGAYLKNGMKKEAEVEFAKAVELDPSDICHYMIGISYWENGDDKKALKYFDKAAETAEVPIILDIATHLYEADRAKDADRFIEKAKQRDPQHPIPYVIKGINLLGMGNPLAMLLGMSKGSADKALKELTEAEKRMVGREEFQDVLRTIRGIRQSLEAGEGPMGGMFGRRGGFGPPPPFMFADVDDDDDDDEFFDDGGDFDPFFEPPQPKKKAKKAKKKKR